MRDPHYHTDEGWHREKAHLIAADISAYLLNQDIPLPKAEVPPRFCAAVVQL